MTFSYDAIDLGAGPSPLNSLDRVTKITFPDGTFQQFDYTLLDAGALHDRGGRGHQIWGQASNLDRVSLVSCEGWTLENNIR